MGQELEEGLHLQAQLPDHQQHPASYACYILWGWPGGSRVLEGEEPGPDPTLSSHTSSWMVLTPLSLNFLL
jgi:hypothetical protein